jgi:hypothetical protein
MIFLVILTLLVYRGTQQNTGGFPYPHAWAFASWVVAQILHSLGYGVACVEECPVDIEHIDHINGMRRHQVLIESAFPQEATTMLNNLERKGNPWGMGEDRRTDWITELDFEVQVIDGQIPEDVEYLFWVGCAGALEDRAKRSTKAIAELLNLAGVKFAVLGPVEACTGDPARRLGNEFVFSLLARQNIETLNDAGFAKTSRKKGPARLRLRQRDFVGVPTSNGPTFAAFAPFVRAAHRQSGRT